MAEPVSDPTASPAPTPRQWLDRREAPGRRWLRLAAAVGLLGGVATLVQAGLLARVITGLVVDGQGINELTPWLLALVGVVALRTLAGWGRDAAGLAGAHRITGAVRAELFDHLARLGPVRLAEYPAGALAGSYVEQVQALEGYYARFRPQMVLAVGVPLLLLAAVAVLDWLAALLLAISAPLIPVFMAIVGMGAEEVSRRQQAALARAGGHFLDRLRGLTTLRLFNRAEATADEVHRVADDYRARTMQTLRVAFLSSAVLEFFAAVAIALVAIYIGFGLLGYIEYGPAPELDLFAGLFILLLAPEFFQPLRDLASHYHDRADGLGAAAELIPLLETPAPALPPARRTPSVPGLSVDLQRVRVTYPDGRTGLEGADLTVAPGDRVVLTGPSGGGKSTLLALLAGFLAADGGRVRIGDGEPEPVSQVAWMGQRTHLFADTLRENIRMGRPGADDADVEAVAQRAGVAEFARLLPDGLDTAVGEGGVGLSGGQAQRVALARTLLKGAPVLLLDEPTAGLDPEGEEALVASLERTLAGGPTVIIATHHPRLMALGRQYRVADGRVEEVGHA
ncbi:MAG: thiol reductant ABC exporter subunit CydD [Pseudomonadota bacterium]